MTSLDIRIDIAQLAEEIHQQVHPIIEDIITQSGYTDPEQVLNLRLLIGQSIIIETIKPILRQYPNSKPALLDIIRLSLDRWE